MRTQLGVLPVVVGVVLAGAAASYVPCPNLCAAWVSQPFPGHGRYADLRDGVLYIAGVSSLNAATLALNAADGKLKWASVFDGPIADYTYGIAASETSDRVYTLIRSPLIHAGGTFNEDIILLNHDTSTGSLIWEYVFDSGKADGGYSLALAPETDAAYVVGSDNSDLLVMRVGANGTKDWIATLDGGLNGTDVGFSVATSMSGSTVFAKARSANTVGKHALYALSAQDGLLLWMKGFAGLAESYFDFANWRVDKALAVSPSGSVFTAGESTQGGFYAGGFQQDGSPLWSAQLLSGLPVDFTYILHHGGLVFVVGRVWQPPSWDIVVVALDASSGAVQWTQSYDHVGKYDAAHAAAVAPDALGVPHLYVAGEGQGILGLPEALVLRFSLQGVIQAAYTHDTLTAWPSPGYSGWEVWGDDRFLDIVADPGGAYVYVAGQSWGTFSPSTLAVAYPGRLAGAFS